MIREVVHDVLLDTSDLRFIQPQGVAQEDRVAGPEVEHRQIDSAELHLGCCGGGRLLGEHLRVGRDLDVQERDGGFRHPPGL